MMMMSIILLNISMIPTTTTDRLRSSPSSTIFTRGQIWIFWNNLVQSTIQNYFLIWISPKTMSYSDQSFRFTHPWSTKKWNLGKSGQNKSPVFAKGEGRCNSFLIILNCESDNWNLLYMYPIKTYFTKIFYANQNMFSATDLNTHAIFFLPYL